jgi:membrane associated rhomboid family serine protease
MSIFEHGIITLFELIGYMITFSGFGAIGGIMVGALIGAYLYKKERL